MLQCRVCRLSVTLCIVTITRLRCVKLLMNLVISYRCYLTNDVTVHTFTGCLHGAAVTPALQWHDFYAYTT